MNICPKGPPKASCFPINKYPIDELTKTSPRIFGKSSKKSNVNNAFNYRIDISILDTNANISNQTFNCEGYQCINQTDFTISGGFDTLSDCDEAPFCICSPYQQDRQD